MKITHTDVHQVEIIPGQSWVFVQIHTNEGLTGIGEMNPSAPRKDCLDSLRKIAVAVRGRDPRQIAAITADLSSTCVDRSAVFALSAIEQGLWDILGKSLDAPVYALLGGSFHREIHLYANITRATPQLTPEVFSLNASKAVADGFDAVKLAPFGGPLFSNDREAGIKNGVKCVHSVRETIGPDISLLLDCYGIFNVNEALAIAERTKDVDLFWFEEPVGPDDFEGYRRIKGETGLRLAGGERLMFRQGFWPSLKNEIFDVAMPDVSVVGGVGELLKIADMATTVNISTAPHGPFGPVINSVQAQIMTPHPGFLMLEYAWGQVPWREDLITPSEKVHNSRLYLSDSPGYGIELNLDTIAAHQCVSSA